MIKKQFTKEQVLDAMDKTRSVKAAARYMNCDYSTMKKYMKFYKEFEGGRSLFEIHRNQCGKGIPKYISVRGFTRKDPPLLDIMNGVCDVSSFNPQKIKFRMFEAGYLREECYHCGFHECRVSDNKIPLIMRFKNGNKQHYRLDNIEMLCYNCYFLFVDEVFTERDLLQLEDHKPMFKTTEAINFELDEYHLKRLKEIGLYDDKSGEDAYDLVSRK